MSVKELIKKCIGFIRCSFANVNNSMSKGTYIGKGVHIVNGGNIKLGNNVQIRPYCDLFAGQIFIISDNCDIGTRNRIVGNVIIENSVLFGPDNYVSSEDHCYKDIDIPVMFQGTYSPNKNGHSEIKIGEGSWIGTHCAIIGDVHIGKHCVVGANSVVTKDIPDYCVVVGNPGKIIKKYNKEKNEWENE